MRRVSDWLFGLILAGTALAAGFIPDDGFSSTGAKSDGGHTTVPKCTDITGKLGLISDWAHSNPTSKSIKSENGQVGCAYENNAPTFCQVLDNAITESTTLEHRYKRESAKATTLTCSLSATAVPTGAAEQYDHDDPSWWWAPTIFLDDSEPTVTVRRYDGSSGEVSWADVTDNYENVDVQGTGGEGAPDDEEGLTAGVQSVLGGYTSGSFAANTGAIPLTGSSGSNRVIRIDVKYVTSSATNRTADNCKITTPWQVVIQSTMTTSVSP